MVSASGWDCGVASRHCACKVMAQACNTVSDLDDDVGVCCGRDDERWCFRTRIKCGFLTKV